MTLYFGFLNRQRVERRGGGPREGQKRAAETALPQTLLIAVRQQGTEAVRVVGRVARFKIV